MAAPEAAIGQTDLLAALMASGDVVYEWDVARDTLSWTGPATDMFSVDDLDGLSSGDLFHGRINSEDLKERLKRLSRHFATGARFDCEYRLRAGDGEFLWVHERGQADFMPDGRPLTMRGVLRTITSRKRAEQRLEYLANYDELTGHFGEFRREVQHRGQIWYLSDAQRETVSPCRTIRISRPAREIRSPL
jgi:hypothetical protein